jgi:hypothetical protein
MIDWVVYKQATCKAKGASKRKSNRDSKEWIDGETEYGINGMWDKRISAS